MVYGINTQFQADLVDMTAYSKENANNKYLLTCIDVFSKYTWARALKNKAGSRLLSVQVYTRRGTRSKEIADG